MGRPALTPPRKLKHASPVLITDAGLLEQLLLATNHNLMPGEGIEDVGPVKVMLESGIELYNVLYTLKGKIDRRAYLGNTALRSWSEHWFVAAVAEAYGWASDAPGDKGEAEGTSFLAAGSSARTTRPRRHRHGPAGSGITRADANRPGETTSRDVSGAHSREQSEL
jgi:hypothetical protein